MGTLLVKLHQSTVDVEKFAGGQWNLSLCVYMYPNCALLLCLFWASCLQTSNWRRGFGKATISHLYHPHCSLPGKTDGCIYVFACCIAYQETF